MALRRDPNPMHRTAYIDVEFWRDYKVGQRVMTREGFAGVVTDIYDGPAYGAGHYVVALDNGVGGGEYAPNDLAPLGQSVPIHTHAALSDLHEASDDYPELYEVLRKRLPPENTVAAIKEQAAREAGWQVVDDQGAVHAGPFDTVYEARDALAEEPIDPSALNVVPEETSEGTTMWTEAAPKKRLREKMLDWYADKTNYEPGRARSIDWCRFRRDQHCYYPKHLDVINTKRAGYAVWLPEDRGYCPRNTWADQEQCPVGKPGPKSGDPMAQPDATISWDEGGQRVSIRTRAANDDELGWHFIASWADVRNKAKRIRTEGHVRVISATAGYVTAEIRGDTNIYQTTIMRVPGGKSTAMWECGCAWANYSWGRSGRWKKYEGRMCAHALALTYEAQAQEMFGKEISEQRNMPQWRNDPTIPIVRPGDARTKPQPWRVGVLKQVGSGVVDEDVLRSAQWFHGSPVRMVEGTILTPGVQRKVNNFPPNGDNSKVWMVSSFDAASLWAQEASHGRSWFVYAVEPVGEVSSGRAGHEESGASAARVVSLAFASSAKAWRNGQTASLAWPVGVLQAEALPVLKVHPSMDEIVDWYQRAARSEEPKVSRDVEYIANAEGGITAGFTKRLKEPGRIEEKLRERGPENQRKGVPPEDWITDALRYTIVFHPALYTQAVQDALYRFLEKGYRIPDRRKFPGAEENMWERGDSYSGLHYILIDPGGLKFELQFHTAESYLLKEKKLHQMLEEFRNPTTPLARRQELFDAMTKFWEDVEIPKDVLGKPERGLTGFPEYRKYQRPASLHRHGSMVPHWASFDADLAMAPSEAIRREADLMARVRGLVKRIIGLIGDEGVKLSDGTIVPVEEVVHPDYDPNRGILDFQPSLSRSLVRDTDVAVYGLLYDPSLLTHPEVIAAQEYDGWKSLPVSTVGSIGLYAIEDTVESAPIDKVVSGREPLRAGYDAHVARLSDGREVVIDGHHRAAMATAMQQPLRAHVLDMSTHKSAYYWKSTGEEISLADLEQIALDHGYTEQDLKSKKADTDKMYPHWLMGVTRPFVYQMWGGPDVPLSLGNGQPSTPWLPRFEHDWDDEAYDDEDERGLVAASLTASYNDPDEYELLGSSRGKQYTHVGVGKTANGQPLALCGTTVAPLDSVWLDYMGAMAQATCPRCLDILRRKQATLHDEPEPALPETDGGDSEISEDSEDERGNVARIGLQGSLEGPGPTTPTGPAWLAPGTGDSGSACMQAHQAANAELATMAREFLKHGSKVFSVEEQQAIINEDTGEPAANLDLLQIEGTHYEQIQRLNQDEMSDESWLM